MPSTIFRFPSWTAGISTFQSPGTIPNSAPLRKKLATFAPWIRYLLGRHAMLGHEPVT